MRLLLASGLVCLTVLAACGSNSRGDIDHVPVCAEQSDWARSGKVPAGEIAISCPKHGIGDYR